MKRFRIDLMEKTLYLKKTKNKYKSRLGNIFTSIRVYNSKVLNIPLRNNQALK